MDPEGAAVLERTVEMTGRSGVFAAFAQMPGDDRDVLGLRIVAGFSPEQAAVGLGVATQTIEPRLADALLRLRAIAPGISLEQVMAALRSLA